MKPRIGSQIRYTEKGAPAGKKAGDIAGTVVHFSSNGRICGFKTPNGETDYFIWTFSDGLNTHFDWDGKDNGLPSAFFR